MYFPFGVLSFVPQIAAFHGKFLLSKVMRCGASQKKTPRDSTKTYSPRGLAFWDVPQIAAFHNKFMRRIASLSNAHIYLPWQEVLDGCHARQHDLGR